MAAEELSNLVPDPDRRPVITRETTAQDFRPMGPARKSTEMAKLSVRLLPETKALCDRLAAFTPDTITDIIQTGTAKEAKRRAKAFEKAHGIPLPELP